MYEAEARIAQLVKSLEPALIVLLHFMGLSLQISTVGSDQHGKMEIPVSANDL